MQKAKVSSFINIFVAFFSLACIIVLLFELGGKNIKDAHTLFIFLDVIVILVFFVELSVNFLMDLKPALFLRKNLFSIFVFSAYLALSSWTPSTGILFLGRNFSIQYLVRLILLLRLALLTLKLLSKVAYVRDFFTSLRLKPAQSIVFGFAAVIFLGTIILALPISARAAKSLPLVDALFTSTSAVCVTGLVVVDTGSYFSLFGQTIIMLLIQTGGLGIMTLAVFIGIFLGSRISLKERQITLNVMDQSSAASIFSLIKQIVKITFIIELIGAAAIFVYHIFNPHPSISTIPGLAFYSVFHSISAFCNAGFSLNSNSLVLLSGNLFGNGIFMFLIVSGGLGFTVILNLKNNFLYSISSKRRKKSRLPQRLTLHSKMVLIMTSILLVGGALLFYLGEADNSLHSLKPAHRLYAAFFQSTTTRTAGFNTVSTSFFNLRPVTFIIMAILMFIGASPGSTGGGVKTTTFYLLLQTIKGMIREQKEVKTLKRIIPRDIVNKAVAIFVLFIALVCVSSVVIMFVETRFSFLQILFEVVSAAATVGLSTGITTSLSVASKIVIIITMFLGRIGPLTLVLAMSGGKRDKNLITYPQEKIMVG